MAHDDYERLTGLAKKQVAAENKEGELAAVVTRLKEENEELTTEKKQFAEQNAALKNENGKLQSVYGQIAISKLRTERNNLQRKFDRVMEFIKELGLMEKLQAFLQPIKRGMRK